MGENARQNGRDTLMACFYTASVHICPFEQGICPYLNGLQGYSRQLKVLFPLPIQGIRPYKARSHSKSALF